LLPQGMMFPFDFGFIPSTGGPKKAIQFLKAGIRARKAKGKEAA